MSEDTPRLSLKVLDKRISLLGNSLDERLRFVEENQAYPLQVVGPSEEYFTDIMVAVINALYVTRSQGAYNMAKALEDKYFDGESVREIGDQLLKSGSLYSGEKKE